MHNFETGFIAEGVVAQYLERNGYAVLDHNWRRPWGEIDVIAEKDGVISFIEVKASAERHSGFEPELRANSRKMEKVVRTARSYLVSNKYPDDKEWQIDVVSVIVNTETKAAKIEHFKNIEV